jgi:hypothetical protein
MSPDGAFGNALLERTVRSGGLMTDIKACTEGIQCGVDIFTTVVRPQHSYLVFGL